METEAPPELPDLLKELKMHRPLWRRLLYLGLGVVLILVGVILWLTPAVPGSIPFYIAGFIFLALASDRVRRWINRLERRPSERFRRKLRRGILKIPSKKLRELVQVPEDDSWKEG